MIRFYETMPAFTRTYDAHLVSYEWTPFFAEQTALYILFPLTKASVKIQPRLSCKNLISNRLYLRFLYVLKASAPCIRHLLPVQTQIISALFSFSSNNTATL